jgi:hypothetical protein
VIVKWIFCEQSCAKKDQSQTTNGCKHDNTSHTHLLYHYFCDYILGIKKKSYYFIKVYVKNLGKNVIFRIN